MKAKETLIAMVAHEVNRAYCQAIGDHSQPEWGRAPLWQKESAIKGVIFHLDGNHGPEASHENWMREKLADGWQWGPVKDPENKRHPCMVPFNELPRAQQVKDHLFRAVVQVMGRNA